MLGCGRESTGPGRDTGPGSAGKGVGREVGAAAFLGVPTGEGAGETCSDASALGGGENFAGTGVALGTGVGMGFGDAVATGTGGTEGEGDAVSGSAARTPCELPCRSSSKPKMAAA